MNRKVKREIILVDHPLLDHNLIEVGHHVIDASQVDHLHIKSHGLVHVNHFNMH